MNTAQGAASNRTNYTVETASSEPVPTYDAFTGILTRQVFEFQKLWLETLAFSISRTIEFWTDAAAPSPGPFKFSPLDWFNRVIQTNVAIQASFLKLFTREANLLVTEVAAEAESFVRAMDVLVETPLELKSVSAEPQTTAIARAAS